MGNLSILSRSEIEGLGPPMLEELADSGIHEQFLCDLTLKHVAMLPDPNTTAVADRLHLPRVLTEELLYHLYREKLIEMRLQNAVGSTRYAMLDHGWERVTRLNAQSGYLGPAPVSLEDYALMMRLQAVPSKPASFDTVRNAFKDLVLPDSLLQTLGCVINSRSSLFLTGLPGTGKTGRIGTHEPGALRLDLDSLRDRSRWQYHSYFRCSLPSSGAGANVDHRTRSSLDRDSATTDHRRW
jgi:hypothetical protein